MLRNSLVVSPSAEFTVLFLSLERAVAKRSLGTGLTAAGVTSSWTWSTTLLSSVTVAYQYGVAGSFFYAACNSTQIMIFSNLAIVSRP